MTEYFKLKNNGKQNLVLVGRFVDGIPERYAGTRFIFDSFLTSFHQDGRLEQISETEALKLIKQMEPRLQAA